MGALSEKATTLFSALPMIPISLFGLVELLRNTLFGLVELHGSPMLVDKTNFGLVLYNHANFYRFEDTSSYWSVKRTSVFLCFSLVRKRQPPASQCITVQ